MFSRHTWQVFIYELRRNFRRRGFLFMTFGVPVIAYVLVFGYQVITDLTSDDTEQPAPTETQAAEELAAFLGINKAGYIDLSGAFEPVGPPLSEILLAYPDEAAAQAALAANEIDSYYVIAEDYLQTGDVTLNLPRLSLGRLDSSPIQELVYAQIAGDTDRQLLARLRSPAFIEEINPEREGATLNEGSRFGVIYIFSLTFIFGLFVTSGYLMQSVIDEKESRLIEILISTVRPTQLLMGKILALGLLGLTQILVWVLALFALVRLATNLGSQLSFLVGLTIPLEIVPVALLYFVLGFLMFAAGFAAVGALSASMQEGPQYAVVFSLPAALPYYFIAIFMQTPDAPLPVILSLFPLTSPLSMIMRLSISPVPPVQIVISLALLALGAVGAMWLAGRLFRVQTLLSGQMPRLRDIPKLLRG